MHPAAHEEPPVNVRIGIADSSKVVELDIDDTDAFETTITSALDAGDAVVWVLDSKKRRVGIPVPRISYIEIETDSARQSVGFGPGV
jgi:hypothetical protein